MADWRLESVRDPLATKTKLSAGEKKQLARYLNEEGLGTLAAARKNDELAMQLVQIVDGDGRPAFALDGGLGVAIEPQAQRPEIESPPRSALDDRAVADRGVADRAGDADPSASVDVAEHDEAGEVTGRRAFDAEQLGPREARRQRVLHRDLGAEREREEHAATERDPVDLRRRAAAIPQAFDGSAGHSLRVRPSAIARSTGRERGFQIGSASHPTVSRPYDARRWRE